MTQDEYNEVDQILDSFENLPIDTAINKHLENFEDEKVIDALEGIILDFNHGIGTRESYEDRLRDIRDKIVKCDCEECLEIEDMLK